MTVFVNSLNYTLVPCTLQSLATHNQKILHLILFLYLSKKKKVQCTLQSLATHNQKILHLIL